MIFSQPWLVAIVILAGMAAMLTRWRGRTEAFWATATALALLASLQVSPAQALHGIIRGHDVYLFLVGMMIVAELARRTGLFDWLAVRLVNRSRGSSWRLFLHVFLAGIAITAIMSNDATAVVMTPAVVAALRQARVASPLPALYACALVANAASFLLPISNPANLVVYGSDLPAFLPWLQRFLLPSCVALFFTFLCLVMHQRTALRQRFDDRPLPTMPLTAAGRGAALAAAVMATGLLTASLLGLPLGWPAMAMGAAALLATAAYNRTLALQTLRSLSWSVLPLVAGLFVMVEALDAAGVTPWLGQWLSALVQHSPVTTGWAAGLGSALASNAVNNLPAGLFAGAVLEGIDAPESVRAAALIGVNLGPNLTLTGSLATLLWLAALRREGMNVTAGQFFRLGLATLPLPLLATLWVML